MYVRFVVHNLIKMNTITATNARSNFFQLLKDTINKHAYTTISSKEGNVVMMSQEEFEGLMETAELSAVPELVESLHEAEKEIERGEVYTMDEVFKS